MYGIIATWRMALEGITKADENVKESWRCRRCNR